MTENKMVGLHHRLDAHEFEQAPGVGDDREAWQAAVLGVTESWTLLGDWTELHSFLDLCSPNRDPTWALGSEIADFYPLDCQ